MAIINGDLSKLKELISTTSEENLFHNYIMVSQDGKSDSFNLLHILLLNTPTKNSDEIMELLLSSGFTLFDRSKNGISVADIFEDIGQQPAADKIRELEISKSETKVSPNAESTSPAIDPVLEAFNKDKKELQDKLQSKADVYIKSISGRIKNMSDSDIMLEFYRSLKYKQPLVLQYLLENGLSVDALDEKGNSPLILAIANENKEFVMKLLSNGASPNLKANDISPLALAIDRTNPSVLISLILAGADIEEKNKDGEKLIDNLLINHTHPLSKPLMSFIFSNSEN
jgi:ankyrin repeat protein